MADWLPSEAKWLNKITDRVFDGHVILVRSIPRWGLTTACEDIANLIGPSAVTVSGRAITENNQKAEREKIDADVRSAINECGFAQLIFDDYGRAIRRSQAGTLHSMLYRLLIDSPSARDTGALLIGRPDDVLDLNFSGSPLISRATSFTLPTLSAEDAKEVGLELREIKELSGDSTWLARRFLRVPRRQGHVSALEHINNDRRRILESLSPAALEVLAGTKSARSLDAASREPLGCLGSFSESGQFGASQIVRESKLLGELKQRNCGWPDTFQESVHRFAELLSGSDNAIWVDRYLFTEPGRAGEFLNTLRSRSRARLRLLTSDDPNRPHFAEDIRAALGSLDDIVVHFMHRHDRGNLHDRHLILPSLGCGFVIPTAGVILGRDAPGSAVSVPMSTLAINFNEYWQRGTKVYP